MDNTFESSITNMEGLLAVSPAFLKPHGLNGVEPISRFSPNSRK